MNTTARAAALLVVSAVTMGAIAMDNPSAPVQWNISPPDPSKPAQGYPVLEGVEHVELFHAAPEIGVYCHHPHIIFHQGVFVATWSNHRDGEDGPGQRVLYSISTDGATWRDFAECFPAIGEIREPKGTGRVLTANGLVVVDDTVYAIAEVDDKFGGKDGAAARAERMAEAGREPRRGRLGWGRQARSVGRAGELGPIFWLVDDPPKPIDGAPQLPPAKAPAFAEIAGKINRALSEPLNRPAWDFRFHTCWTTAEDGHGMCEPTTYRRPDGVFVKLSRDLQGSRWMYASLSEDGDTWTTPVQTNIPDQPSKAVSGALPDGRIYLIGNQVGKGPRDPLSTALSKDGKTFDWAAAIRCGAPQIRHAGLAKGKGFQYPSAIVVGDALWVIYSIGKEDVAVSRVPLSSLPEAR